MVDHPAAEGGLTGAEPCACGSLHWNGFPVDCVCASLELPLGVRVSCQSHPTLAWVALLGLTGIVWCTRVVFDHIGGCDRNGWVIGLRRGGALHWLFTVSAGRSGSVRGKPVEEDWIRIKGNRRARGMHLGGCISEGGCSTGEDRGAGWTGGY